MNDMESMNPLWSILLEFLGALIYIWIFSRLKASFTQNPSGGIMFGLLMGIIMTVPGLFYEFLMYKGFPLWLSFVWIAGFIVKYGVYGAVLGILVKPKKTTA